MEARSPTNSGASHQFFAPDISGYGANGCALELPMTLAEEVRCLSGTLNDADGTDPSRRPFLWRRDRVQDRDRFAVRASRAQPDADRAGAADAAVRERRGPAAARRASPGRAVRFPQDLWNGSVLEAIDKFTEFWNGSGPQEPLPASARLRMIERADKLAFDFTAAFAEENVAAAAAGASRADAAVFGRTVALSHPAHRRSGSAYIIDGADVRHLPGAGHMLPITHASIVNPEIARHIARADELADVPLALEAVAGGGGQLAGGVDVSWRLAAPAGLLVSGIRPETGNEMPMTIRRARPFAEMARPDRGGHVLPVRLRRSSPPTKRGRRPRAPPSPC